MTGSKLLTLDDQAALALAEAVRNNQVRWAALLTWAGADPVRYVPTDLDQRFPVDPDDCTTAAREAVWRGSPKLTKALHLKPDCAQAIEPLAQTAYDKADIPSGFTAGGVA